MNETNFTSLFKEFCRRFNQSKYAFWLFVFVALQACFILLIRYGTIDLNGWVDGKQNAQTACLIMTVNLLLIANTITFMADAKSIIQDLSRVDNVKAIDSSYDKFISCLIFSVFISGGMAILIVLAVLGLLKVDWHTITLTSEFASLFTFSLFLIADLFCYLCGKKIIVCSSIPVACPHPDKGSCPDTVKVAKFLKTLKVYILAVDAPGLLGIIFIMVCGFSLSHILEQKFYWEGFIAGAIGLHITFSQAALAFLSIQEGEIRP